jgi:hypothetical protein
MKTQIENQNGQATTEIVLMLVLSMGIVLIVITAARNNGWLASLVSTPWQSIASTIQNGVPGSVSKTSAQHPNSYIRWNTVKGDTLQ